MGSNTMRREVREVATMAPQIDRVSAKIATLERRAEWLETRIARGTDERARSFDEAEHSALEAAIKALKYHRAALEPETDPVLILQELVDSLDEAEFIHLPDRLRDAAKRAESVLEEIGAD